MSIVRVPFSLTGGSAGSYVPAGAIWLDGSADELSFTPSSTGSTKKIAFDAWVKFDLKNNAATEYIFSANNAGGADGLYWRGSDNYLGVVLNGGTSANVSTSASALLRDGAAWGHLRMEIDTDLAEADRIKLYWNRERLTLAGTMPTSGYTFPAFNVSGKAHVIGRYASASQFSGYLSQVIYDDGLNTTQDTTTETDSNGVVIPKNPTDFTLGTNSAWLDFSNSAAFGTDATSNGNDWTLTSITSANATNDNPADDADNNKGNYAIINPLDRELTTGTMPLTDGNRSWGAASGSYWTVLPLTIPVTSGKFIVACSMGDLTTGSVARGIGLSTEAAFTRGTGGNQFPGGADFGSDAIGILDRSGVDPNELIVAISQTTTNTGSQLASDDQFVIALDADAGKAWLGWWDNSASTLYWYDSSATARSSDEPGSGTNATLSYTAGTQMLFSVFGIVTGASSEPSLLYPGDWSFTAPSGFKALSTANLPAPTVTDPSAYFQTTLYTGNATASRDITQTGNSTFQPDLVIIKNRDQADEWKWVDAVRGVTKELNSDSTNAESTDANGVTAFNADGFELGTGAGGYNDNTENFVAYQLKAGGSGSSNTDGSITSTVSAADHSGFSIGTYTGVGSTGTVGHGLGQTPDMIINKRTDSATGGGWAVWHKDFGDNHDVMFLNGTAAVDSSDTNYWNDTAPTSSVYSVKDNSGIHNASGGTYLTYCFARTPGLIGIGSYTGNNSTDGPYVVVDDGASGFRPAWLMIKRTDTTGSWIVKNIASDPYNPMEAYLQADTSDIENTSPTSLVLDGTANGFKIRHTGGLNGSGGTFIYLAFADHPFGGEGVEQARAR